MINLARLNRTIIFCLVILFVISSSTWAKDYNVDIRDFGAKGDGKTDDTLAFQKALNQTGSKGGIVLVPPGQYRLDGVISVPEGVTLEGVWRGPHTSQLDKGSTLLAYAGRDKENSKPFISLKTDSTLKGVTIFYPEQNVTDIRLIRGPYRVEGRTTISSMLLSRTHITGLIAEPSTMKGITSVMSLCVL